MFFIAHAVKEDTPKNCQTCYCNSNGQEIKILKKIDEHENIVRYFGKVEMSKSVYLILDHCESDFFKRIKNSLKRKYIGSFWEQNDYSSTKLVRLMGY